MARPLNASCNEIFCLSARSATSAVMQPVGNSHVVAWWWYVVAWYQGRQHCQNKDKGMHDCVVPHLAQATK